MTAVRDARVLEDARGQGCAVGAFSVYNLEGALVVCRAAEAEGVPVILLVGSSAFRYAGRRPLAALAVAASESCVAPVGMYPDHSRDPDEVRECLALGYSSVMFDGSCLPFGENVARTREAARTLSPGEDAMDALLSPGTERAEAVVREKMRLFSGCTGDGRRE